MSRWPVRPLQSSCWILWLAVVAGCRIEDMRATADTSPSADSAVTPRSPDSSEWCSLTSGRWNRSLRACYCDAGTVFSVLRGCVPIRREADKIGNIRVAFDGTPYEGTDEELHLLLKGLPVELVEDEADTKILVRFRAMSARHIENTLSRHASDLSDTPIYDLLTLQNEGLDLSQLEASCSTLLRPLSARDGAREIGALCAALNGLLVGLQHDHLDEKALFFGRVMGDSANAGEHALANVSSSSVDGLLSYVGNAGGIYTRTLTLTVGHRWNVRVLLAPSGAPMGGVAVHRERQGAGSAFLMNEHVVTFDRLLLPLAHYNQAMGKSETLRQSAYEWLIRESMHSVPEPLITDGRLSPILEPLRAIMLEYGVDTGYFPLAQRLNYAEPAVLGLFQTGRMQQPWFGGSVDLEEAIEQIAPESLEAGHGTAVGSLLAADLPNLKISLMPASSSSYIGPPSVIASRLIGEIARQAPMVVNISQDFSESIADCESVFGTVFRHFSEKVLFVLAAANDGLHDPQNRCPASLAGRYKNVLTVGGVNDDGTIGGSGGSNFGKKFVQVAAPFCQDVAVYAEKRVSMHRLCGTSFAAPVVANAALRVLAQLPLLEPYRVAELLMSACDRQGLEVACGGSLNFNKLDELISQVLDWR